MSSSCPEKEPETSSADELFYKGKLLPLHLPPRLKMVQKLLQSSNTTNENKTKAFEEHHHIPFTTTTTKTHTTTSPPLESCNIFPSDSCHSREELNPDEYFFDCSADVTGFIGLSLKSSWFKKLKLIKQSSLSLKLKASSSYFKSLFSKSRCSDKPSAEIIGSEDGERSISKSRDCLNKHMKVTRKNPLGDFHSDRHQMRESLL